MGEHYPAELHCIIIKKKIIIIVYKIRGGKISRQEKPKFSLRCPPDHKISTGENLSEVIKFPYGKNKITS